MPNGPWRRWSPRPRPNPIRRNAAALAHPPHGYRQPMTTFAPNPASGDLQQPYCLADWQRGYQSQRQETAYWLEASEIVGDLPPALTGTLFRNGPALFERGGRSVQHPFDGDGMVAAVTFTAGRVHFANRFVRTAGFVAEEQAERFLYRGVFGTPKPGGWLANAFDFRVKNIANTNVIYWGGKLLALWEAAAPHRLEPETLATLGLEDFQGLLGPDDAFSAHPRVDPESRLDGGQPCLVNFAIRPGLSTAIALYEFDSQGQLRRQQTQTVPGFAFIHDFAITPRYALFLQNPVTFNPLPFALGWRGAAECIRFQAQQPTQLWVIPRDPQAGEPVRTLAVQAGFIFHHANAWELADGRLGLVSICYPDFPEVEPGADFRAVNFAALPPGQLWRFTFDLATGTVERQRLLERCCEFPTLHPAWVGREARYLYLGVAHQAQGNAPLQGLLKLDGATGDRQDYSFAPRGYASEPVFVPRPGAIAEDEGWVLQLVYDAQRDRSEVAIFDAQRLAQGPQARLLLRDRLPYGLHGCWTSQTFVR